jgi:lysophospholipase L1-like esterase
MGDARTVTGHVVLVGDSILDNAAYTDGAPSVIEQLQAAVPADWQATLCAVDGHTTREVARQFDRIPADATHLVLSIGGNDALGHQNLLAMQHCSSAEVLLGLAAAAEAFGRRYRAVVAALRARGLPLVVCTIFEGNYPEPLVQRIRATALTIFDDVILRVAIEHALPVIDLRFVCSQPADYANPIEPSSAGGAKIVAAIMGAVGVTPPPPVARISAG